MTHQSRIQEYRPRRERVFQDLDPTGVDYKTGIALSVAQGLRPQIARWVNEGGAGDDDTATSAPERVVSDRKLQN
jgi:hypothetical protein